MGQRRNDVAKMAAQAPPTREECVSGRGQRSNDAAKWAVQIRT